MSKNKKKKSKITYVDDGRTIADMSAIGGGRRGTMNINEKGGCKAQFQTYIAAVRSMLVPMFVTMGIITVAFLIMYIIMSLAS